MKKLVVLIVVLLLIVGGYFLLRGGEETSTSEGVGPEQQPQLGVPAPGAEDVPEMIVSPEEGETVPEASEPEPATEEPPVEQVVLETMNIGITANDFAFSQSTINLSAGENVRLTLVNEGNFTHDFVVEGLDIKTSMVNGGKSESIEFSIAESGTYVFYCSIGNHRDLGMVGEIVVQ